MSKHITRISRSRTKIHQTQHRYEHWLVNNQIYFITARCRDKFPAFASEQAKFIFWDRFNHYTRQFGFVPWVTSLLDNHYHTEGYMKDASGLPLMMQRLHGSVAKIVNDLLPRRFPEFWRNAKGHEYFDGCIRDEKQARLAYRYTLMQSVRHGIASDYRLYPHTRVNLELETAIARAREIDAFLEGVPYKRYRDRQKHGPAR